MKLVFVLFDSLNRHLLEPYGGTRIATPNFNRLAARGTTFDRHYVGSMPCMPARRDLLTGRLSFLHRSWGPLEPFDVSFPQLLAQRGIYSHLITDHNHYFENGGATYHTNYDTWDFIRGQEADTWKAMVEPPWERLRDMYHPDQFSNDRRSKFARHMVNRLHIREEAEFPSAQCFQQALEFLDENRRSDDWFLQLETFDPHEPFHAPERFRSAYSTGWNGPIRDWPRYGRVEEPPEDCAELRGNYYALVAFCDSLLGKLLDYFDQHDLWSDTALVVTTDHGFLLGEHDFWAKNRTSLYEEISHIPLIAYHPGARVAGVRNGSLTQTIDLAPTFLDVFGCPIPASIQGLSFLPATKDGHTGGREAAIFGYFGGAVNVTDGRMVYHRFPSAPTVQEVFQYTLMPQHMLQPFSPDELSRAQLAPPFPFTSGMPVLKIPMIHTSPMYNNYGPGSLIEGETRLYDLVKDPGQIEPLSSSEDECRLASLMIALMKDADAPEEAFSRLRL